MLVGVAGTDLKVFAKHVRKSELEQIAETIGADLVLLQRRKQEAGEEDEDVEVPK